MISTDLTSFLASHPFIEVLSLTCIQIDGFLVLPAGALPYLKRLSTDAESMLAHSILGSTTSIPRPLEYIMGPRLNDAFLDRLEQSLSGPSLKKLTTVCSDDLNHLITRLSGIAPNLEWLDTGFHNINLQTVSI